MLGEIDRKLEAALSGSELLLAAAGVRADGGLTIAIGDSDLRHLHADEIHRLEAQGNCCEDWSRVRAADGFNWRRVQHSTFLGDVVLGRFDWWLTVAGQELHSGIYHATIANCVIGHDVLVRDVRLLANYVVERGAVLLDCGRITCDPTTTFGNGAILPIGIETGGRELPIYAEIDIDVAAAMSGNRHHPEDLARYGSVVADYATRACCGKGIIEHDAIICHTPQVCNTYVGPHARIEGATGVCDCTLLSNAEEPVHIDSGAWVRESLLQWGSRVSTLAVVERSVLTEHSHVDRQGKVTASILGPNTGVAEGEATACLLGPFVGFHHHAMLIAALWPEGKGNVSHGANAGSNHTARAPDQEFWPGEGTFLGLGVNVRFPCNLRRSPYTIIASGVQMLPQRVDFPFALINAPSRHDVPAGSNEIVPAWVLSQNTYMLKRTEEKLVARNRARRANISMQILRPDTVDLMLDASRRLQVGTIKEVYTDQDIRGLGKNYLVEAQRASALSTYRFFMLHYALMGLKQAVEQALEQCKADFSPNMPEQGGPWWEHQRRLLRDEFEVTDVVAGLRLLPGMLDKIATAVEQSKAKDDVRGVRVIDDYAEVHPAAAQDPVVQNTYREVAQTQKEVRQLIVDWQSRSSLEPAYVTSVPLLAAEAI